MRRDGGIRRKCVDSIRTSLAEDLITGKSDGLIGRVAQFDPKRIGGCASDFIELEWRDHGILWKIRCARSPSEFSAARPIRGFPAGLIWFQLGQRNTTAIGAHRPIVIGSVIHPIDQTSIVVLEFKLFAPI